MILQREQLPGIAFSELHFFRRVQYVPRQLFQSCFAVTQRCEFSVAAAGHLHQSLFADATVFEAYNLSDCAGGGLKPRLVTSGTGLLEIEAMIVIGGIQERARELSGIHIITIVVQCF